MHQGRDVVRGTGTGATETFQEEEKMHPPPHNDCDFLFVRFFIFSKEADTLIPYTPVSTVN